MTSIICIYNKSLFPQNETKRIISCSKFKAKTLTNTKNPQLLHPPGKINTSYSLKNSFSKQASSSLQYTDYGKIFKVFFFFWINLWKHISQLKELYANFVPVFKLFLGSHRSLPTSQSRRYLQESTSETFLSPISSHTLKIPVSHISRHPQLSSLVIPF